MAILSPTIASALSSSYSVNLPGLILNIETPRRVSVQKTVSGSAFISMWNNDVAGEEREAALTLNSSNIEKLRAAKNAGLYEWLLRINGKIFKCYFDIISVLPNQELKDHHDIILRFIFTEEVTAA